MDLFVSSLEVPLRLVLAAVFGGILGFERETKDKPAGLRTHILVSMGSACFALIGFEIYASVENKQSTDPIRVVEGIAGGIGFLGAGVILNRGASVKGLTTAASLWMVGAIGLACGGGHYVLAISASIIAFIVLHFLLYVEHRWMDRERVMTKPSAEPNREQKKD